MLFALLLLIGLLIAGKIMGELFWSHIALCILIALGIFMVFITFNWEPRLYTVALAVTSATRFHTSRNMS